MPDISTLWSNPGLWLAIVAVIINFVSRYLAQTNESDQPNPWVMWLKIISLALAIGGLILVGKQFIIGA